MKYAIRKMGRSLACSLSREQARPKELEEPSAQTLQAELAPSSWV